MAKVITFSKSFPSYHPKKGEPTYFVEKFLKSFDSPELRARVFDHKAKIGPVSYSIFDECLPKLHTVRVGRRWKAGDYFSPRYWGTNINAKSGRSGPYHSDQIEIMPPQLITRTYDLLLHKHSIPTGTTEYSHVEFVKENDKQTLYDDHLGLIAVNDGLNLEDFKDWTLTPVRKQNKKNVVEAQIICWSNFVDYDNNPDWLPF